MKLHQVLGTNSPVACQRLQLIKFAYLDFEGSMHEDGEIVVMDAAAKHVRRVFDIMRERQFPLAKVRTMDKYDGDDEKSMIENNTSAFNDRPIAGSQTISIHAYGLAIDINPVQNPFVHLSKGFPQELRSERSPYSGENLTYSPPGSWNYANRRTDRPWKDHRPGMAEQVIEVFAENGFLIWGGDWDDPIDYQHFQVGRKLAELLAVRSPGEAEKEFDKVADLYRNCRRSSGPKADRASCVMIADPTSGNLSAKPER